MELRDFDLRIGYFSRCFGTAEGFGFLFRTGSVGFRDLNHRQIFPLGSGRVGFFDRHTAITIGVRLP